MLEGKERGQRDPVQGHGKNFEKRVRNPKDQTPGHAKQKHMARKVEQSGKVAGFSEIAKFRGAQCGKCVTVRELFKHESSVFLTGGNESRQ